ncbi:MAG: hypothetical protein AB1420_00310 [Bacillota bacterium]
MDEDIKKIFDEDSREKKMAAHGAKYRASRTGKIGAMKMPSDFAGKEYKKSSPLLSYKIEDIINMINNGSLLKKLIMERIDTDYEYFRSILEQTIDAIFETNEKVITIMLSELDSLRKKVEDLNTDNNNNNNLYNRAMKNSQVFQVNENTLEISNKDVVELKMRVFKRLNETEDAGIRLTSNNVLKRHPVINYYLYQQKLWPGYKKMIEDYQLNFKSSQ